MAGSSQEIVSGQDAVFVVIDIQERLAGVMPRREAVVASAAKMVRASGVLGLPVLVTRQYPKGLGDTVTEVAEAAEELPEELSVGVVDKTAFCCGAEPAFSGVIEDLGRSQVVLAGMETHICVTQTALDLRNRGMSVFVLADACCSRGDADHEIALARMRQAGCVITTSESVMYEVLGWAGTPEFKSLLEIVKET